MTLLPNTFSLHDIEYDRVGVLVPRSNLLGVMVCFLRLPSCFSANARWMPRPEASLSPPQTSREHNSTGFGRRNLPER